MHATLSPTVQVHHLQMSEMRDYGLDGDAPPSSFDALPMRPGHTDLEAHPPTSHSPYSDNKFNPTSPTESVRTRKPTRSNTVRTYRPERRGHDWYVTISVSIHSPNWPRCELHNVSRKHPLPTHVSCVRPLPGKGNADTKTM